MIPEQLKFDLNLNDLPVRAEYVSSASLSLSAGVNPTVIYFGKPCRRYDSGAFGIPSGWTHSGFCNHFCIQKASPQGLYCRGGESVLPRGTIECQCLPS